MNSSVAGKNISEIEIQNISGFGIWLLVRGKEYFMSYEMFCPSRGDTVRLKV
jgi:hypothetical protein